MNIIICSLFKFEVPKVSSISLAISSLFPNIEFGFRTTLNSDETRPFPRFQIRQFFPMTQAIHFDFVLFSRAWAGAGGIPHELTSGRPPEAGPPQVGARRCSATQTSKARRRVAPGLAHARWWQIFKKHRPEVGGNAPLLGRSPCQFF
mgnify:CR=1 FL=1